MATTGISRPTRILSAVVGIVGVLLIGTSFGINNGPSASATASELAAFGAAHSGAIMVGAWLQAVGPVLIIFFAFALVHQAGLAGKLSGWMTLFGAVVLMMVSLTECVFYVAALFPLPESQALIATDIAHAVQHFYFIVAAPALFLPLGIVVITSGVLPRVLGWLAVVLAAAFTVLGITSLHSLVLSAATTSLAAVQALWWLAAAIALMARKPRAAEGQQ